MNEGERVFSISIYFILLTAAAAAVFHVAFGGVQKQLHKRAAEIVSLERENANADARFGALIRPDILRPIVMRLYPSARPIGAGAGIRIKDME
ncbi:MAG: hypothetical protein LBL46_03670 [Rickettsiales bacterium]|jgi:hypothetical protein|nr:hypothetical protein [Rickettsiales bacterium]